MNILALGINAEWTLTQGANSIALETAFGEVTLKNNLSGIVARTLH